jgi:hypothetical protein
MMRHDDQGRRLCSAHAKSTGLLCRAPAVKGATVCIRHGAAKGTLGREKADNLVLSELVGPALWRLKGLIDSKETPPAVLISAIREVLDRSGYREMYQMTDGEMDTQVQQKIADLEADMTPAELAEVNHRSHGRHEGCVLFLASG